MSTRPSSQARRVAGFRAGAVHCGINLYTIERLKKQGYRYGGLVSKGGVSMVAWMLANGDWARSVR